MSLAVGKGPPTAPRNVAADARLVAYSRRDSDSSDSHYPADRGFTQERLVGDLTAYPPYQVNQELCDSARVIGAVKISMLIKIKRI